MLGREKSASRCVKRVPSCVIYNYTNVPNFKCTTAIQFTKHRSWNETGFGPAAFRISTKHKEVLNVNNSLGQ